MNDLTFNLKPDDRAPADDARVPALVAVETVQPRRVRSQLAALDSHVLGLQDDVESLFGIVTSRAGRETLRAIYSGLGEAHDRVKRIVESVERGG